MAFFTSADQVITNGTTYSLAHGLGTTPKMVQAFLVCQTANNGFSVGDILGIHDASYGTDDSGCSMKVDGTNVTVYTAAPSGGVGCFFIVSTTGVGLRIQNNQWKLRIIAQS